MAGSKSRSGCKWWTSQNVPLFAVEVEGGPATVGVCRWRAPRRKGVGVGGQSSSYVIGRGRGGRPNKARAIQASYYTGKGQDYCLLTL